MVPVLLCVECGKENKFSNNVWNGEAWQCSFCGHEHSYPQSEEVVIEPEPEPIPMEPNYAPRLHPDDIQAIAQATYEMMYNDMWRMIQNVENMSGTICNIPSTISNEASHTRQEVRSSVSGLHGTLYSIQSRVDSIRR